MIHTVCDQCKESQPTNKTHDWLEVNRNSDLIYFGRRTELHFCSWECLTKYALDEANLTKKIKLAYEGKEN